MSGTFRPTPRYPSVLGAQIAQAEQLARALRSVGGRAMASDPSFLWLVGRADDVRTFVDEMVREWHRGMIDTARACAAIRAYVGPIHVALHRRYGGYGACCCSPHLEPFAPPRAVADGGMRPRLKSGILEIDLPDGPPSQVRARSLGPIRTQDAVAGAPARRKQAG
jgi:hypothetical protein